MKDLFHSWTVCKLFFSKITQPFSQKLHECAPKLIDLWVTSLSVWEPRFFLALDKSIYYF